MTGVIDSPQIGDQARRHHVLRLANRLGRLSRELHFRRTRLLLVRSLLQGSRRRFRRIPLRRRDWPRGHERGNRIFGIPYAGWIYDRTGSYDIAFITFLGAYALAITAALFLRLPAVEPGAAPQSTLAGDRSGAAASDACAAG